MTPDSEPLPGFSDEGISAAVNVDLSEFAVSQLLVLGQQCWADPESSLSILCNGYVHDACGASGWTTGVGARDGLALDKVCLSGVSAEPLRVEFSEALGECQEDPGCAGSPECINAVTTDCLAAVDQRCLAESAEYGAGFGPVARDGSGVDILCMRGKAVSRALVPVSTLAPDSSCDGLLSAGDPSQACALRISEYCGQTSGFSGGIGPLSVPNASDEVSVACLLETEAFVRNSDVPDSPALPIDVLSLELLRDGFGDLILDANGLPQYAEAHSRHSHIKATRNASNDGRLISGPTYTYPSEDPTGNWLALNMPEKLSSPLGAPTPDGATSVSAGSPFGERYELDMDALYGTPGQSPSIIHHISVCDAGSNLGSPNPRPCDGSGTTTRTAADTFDCYDVTLLNTLTGGGRLWGTAVTARVEDPKTDTARVVDVSYGTPVQTPWPGMIVFEPSVTGDGRLLVVHGIGTPDFGLQYSYVAPPGSGSESDPDWGWNEGDPCDASQWDKLRPVSSMYADPYLDAYPVARYPVRGNEGRLFLLDEKVEGAYPWIDRAGTLIAFAHAGATLGYVDPGDSQIHSRYPIVSGTAPEAGFDSNTRLKRAIFGLWTHGKIVNVDNRMNPADFGLDGPEHHHELSLYVDDLDQPVHVEVGGTTAHLVTSTESVFAYDRNMRSVSPRDVVWHFSQGTPDVSVSDEVAFDDFLFPDTLILSAMNASVENATGMIQDGFEYTAPRVNGVLNRGKGFTSPGHIANAATAVSKPVAALSRAVNAKAVLWEVPAYGKVLGGARIEPIAAGGIVGKGLWLDGVDDRLEYSVEHATGATRGREIFFQGSWYTSLALDPRNLANDSEQRLISWPDGSFIDLLVNGVGGQSLYYGRDDVAGLLVIPAGLELAPRSWGHLAVASEPNGVGGFRARFYWQGFLLEVIEDPGIDLFRPTTGLFTLGWKPGAGVAGLEGWIDDFKVMAHVPNAEEVCNHAHGTLASVFDASGQEAALFATATAFDAGGVGQGWQELDALLGASSGEKFACERRVPEPGSGEDYLCYGKLRAPEWNAVAGACLREAVNGGPVFADAPRSDETQNGFCLTCHDPQNATVSLDVDTALAPGFVNAPDDPRRQPFQHATHLFGRIPATHILAGPFASQAGLPTTDWPASDISAGSPYENGEPIDDFSLPTAPP